MKMTKKFLAFVLVLSILVSSLSILSNASSTIPESGSDYTTVLVHGLLGWGSEDGLSEYYNIWGLSSGDMPEYLTSLGYDVFVASVGPISSAHDRCCELFAQLTGSKVDYGQAHVDDFNTNAASNGSKITHQRFGNDYTGNPQIEKWGPIYDNNGNVVGWYDNKINLVGHSFGGPTIVEFLDLLENGDQKEIAWGKQQAALYGGDWHNYVSPLFWGDYNGRYLVNSITSIAGVLNGTTFITANSGAMDVMTTLLMAIANLEGSTKLNELYDFQLDQFGLTTVPGSDIKSKIDFIKQSGFIEENDHAFYDLTTYGTNELKQGWQTYNNVYYFSYSCDKSYQSGSVYLPKLDMFSIMIPFSIKMGKYINSNEIINNVDGSVYGSVDNNWLANDGMVNTITSRYPLGSAHKDFDMNNITSGVWNVHPDQNDDHFSIVGNFTSPNPIGTRKFFYNLMECIKQTKPVSNSDINNAGINNRCLPSPTISSIKLNLLKKPVLNWNAIKGSAYYEIYRSTNPNGEYKKIGTSLISSYTDLTAKSKTTYYYKVIATPLTTSKNISSVYSNMVSIKT